MGLLVDQLIGTSVYATVAILVLARPFLVAALLPVILGCRRPRSSSIYLSRRRVYLLGSLFALTFVLAGVVLSSFWGLRDTLSTLLVNPPIVNYGSIVISYVSLFLGIVHVMRKHNVPVKGLVSTRSGGSHHFTLGLVVLLAGILAVVVSLLLREIWAKRPGLDSLGTVLGLACNIGLIPCVEELYFRGVIYNTLKDYYRPVTAAIVSALYFAAAHLPYLLVGMLPFVAFGLIYVWLYERCRSLLPGMILHALINGVALLR